MSATSQTGTRASVKSASKNFSELLEKARQFSGFALAEAAATDAPDSFPARTFEKITEANLLEAVAPEKYGGASLGIEAGTTLQLLTLLKWFGYGNLIVGRIYEGHFNAWQLINEYGDDALLKNSSRDIRKLFGVWNTEAGDGVKIEQVDEKFFGLRGAKTFASGVGYVTRPIVTGRTTEGGWQMFVAPLDEIETTVNESFWKPLGMRASRSYRVDFSGVKISKEMLVGAADDYYRQPFFSGGAIRFAAVQLGAAELLLDLTVEFLRELNRTNDPFQRARIGEMAIQVESGNLWLQGAARIFDEYLHARDEIASERAIHYAGMMRTAIEGICQSVMLNCERAVGSRGLLQPYHFERVIRDLKTYLRQAAPDAALAGVGAYALESAKPNHQLWRDDER